MYSFKKYKHIVAKKSLPLDIKMKEVKDLLDECDDDNDLRKTLYRSIDKIMIAHRNTKLFMLMMSGPFLITITLIKYLIKLAVLYFILKYDRVFKFVGKIRKSQKKEKNRKLKGKFRWLLFDNKLWS